SGGPETSSPPAATRRPSASRARGRCSSRPSGRWSGPSRGPGWRRRRWPSANWSTASVRSRRERVRVNGPAPERTALVIEVSSLAKSYGGREVLRGVSFTVRPGEAVAYLGPNGAGKSTTVKIIAGLLSSGGGQVRVCGHDVESEPLLAKKRLGYVPDSARLY